MIVEAVDRGRFSPSTTSSVHRHAPSHGRAGMLVAHGQNEGGKDGGAHCPMIGQRARERKRFGETRPWYSFADCRSRAPVPLKSSPIPDPFRETAEVFPCVE
jgi:hypothetical protein